MRPEPQKRKLEAAEAQVEWSGSLTDSLGAVARLPFSNIKGVKVMRATILHESRGRMRLRLSQKSLSLRQADLLEAWLKSQPWVREAVVHERTRCYYPSLFGKPQSGSLIYRRVYLGRSRKYGCPACAHYTRSEPAISGETCRQSTLEGIFHTVSAHSGEYIHSGVSHDPIFAQGTAMSNPEKDEGGAA